MIGSGMLLLNGCDLLVATDGVSDSAVARAIIKSPESGEDVFAYIQRELSLIHISEPTRPY